MVVSRVTSDLPLQHIPANHQWNHLSGLQLADPTFDQPGKIDLLLGVEIFAEVVLPGWQHGVPGSPVAFETQFGWVLARNTSSGAPAQVITSHHTMLLSWDDLLRHFWEVEKVAVEDCLTPEESAVMVYFSDHHTRLKDGRFSVPLPKKPGVKPLGESRSQVSHFRAFATLQRTLSRVQGSD